MTIDPSSISLDSPDVLVLRAVILYLPIATALALMFTRPLSKRRIAAIVISGCVALANLLALNIAAQHLGWWSFIDSAAIVGMPADIWLGWAVFWGPLPALVLPERPTIRHGVLIVAAAFVIDLATMPLLEPAVNLGSTWLIGEFVGLGFVLLPSVAIAMFTLTDRWVTVRAIIQAAGFSVGLVVLPPALSEIVLDVGFDDLAARPRWLWSLAIIAAFPAAVTGLTAMVDFAKIGRGTPVPLDPPRRLVTTGPYAYISNPMQTAIVVVLAVYCAMLGHWLTAVGACAAFAFAAGAATRIEAVELDTRFGADWALYRAQVRSFIPRWRPIVPAESAERAVLWVGATCDECRSAGDFLFGLGLVGIERKPAERSPRPLNLMTYEGPNGEYATGVAAVGRALEHANLGWAIVGWTLRLPLLTRLFQLIANGTGAGPRVWIPADSHGSSKEISEISA